MYFGAAYLSYLSEYEGKYVYSTVEIFIEVFVE